MEKCDICGSPLKGTGKPNIEVYEGAVYQYCGNCAVSMGFCPTCKQAHVCDFETNPSPLPKQVQKVVRQGPMTATTVVHNPDRVAETCAKDCPCFDTDFDCMKQSYPTCGHFVPNFPPKAEEPQEQLTAEDSNS